MILLALGCFTLLWLVSLGEKPDTSILWLTTVRCTKAVGVIEARDEDIASMFERVLGVSKIDEAIQGIVRESGIEE